MLDVDVDPTVAGSAGTAEQVADFSGHCWKPTRTTRDAAAYAAVISRWSPARSDDHAARAAASAPSDSHRDRSLRTLARTQSMEPRSDPTVG
jgi:hypothetical protein